MSKKDEQGKVKVPYLKPEVASLNETETLTGGGSGHCMQ